MYARGAPPTAVMRYLERQADKGSEEAEYMLRQYLDARSATPNPWSISETLECSDAKLLTTR